MAVPQYMIAFYQAVTAYPQGQFRRSADCYWTAFGQATSVGRWEEPRFGIFTGYTSVLLEKHFPASDQDLRNLQKVLNDQEEVILFRVEACRTLGLLNWDRHDREAAADYYRQAMALADSATETELCRSVGNELGEQRTVRELIDTRRKEVTDNLLRLQNISKTVPTLQPNLRSNGTYFTTTQTLQTPWNDPELIRRSTVGGKECDSCHKTLAQLGVTILNCCAACKAAYYCSQACQRAAWKAGHKEACRKPNELRAGDVMRLVGLEARPELNGRLVTLVEAEPSDRWQVKLYPDNRAISVSMSKLVHLRPAK